MKALTVLQPWAQLIVSGAKDVENRTWRTNHRGPLLIHAGKKRGLIPLDHARQIVGRLVVGTEYADRYTFAAASAGDARSLWMGAVGGIVGVVDLVDVVDNSPSPWASGGHWHWILANPRPLPFFACAGRLQLFDIEVPS